MKKIPALSACKCLGLTSILAWAALTATPALARIETFFASDHDLSALMRAELRATQRTVDVMVPNLSDGESLTQLSQLARAGKRIRLITQAPAKGGCTPCARLESVGVDVRLVEPNVLHHTFIVDGPHSKNDLGRRSRLLIVGNAVDPRSPDPTPSNLLIASAEDDLALAYQDEFNFIWSRAKEFGKSLHPKVVAVKRPNFTPALFSSSNMIPVASRRGLQISASVAAVDGVIAEQVSGAFNHAYNSIDVVATTVGRADIYHALTQALARGVRVRILLPHLAFDKIAQRSDCTLRRGLDPDEEFALADECLAFMGAELRYYSSGPQGGDARLSTFAIVDGKRLLAANFGLSIAAETESLGAVISTRGSSAVSYSQHFEQLFGATSKARPSLLASTKAKNEKAAAHDCAFEPRALSMASMAALKALVEDGTCSE